MGMEPGSLTERTEPRRCFSSSHRMKLWWKRALSARPDWCTSARERGGGRGAGMLTRGGGTGASLGITVTSIHSGCAPDGGGPACVLLAAPGDEVRAV